MSSEAPPLGNRPMEPKPGKDSLANPRGADGDGGNGAGGAGDARPTCPDCGLPFGEHPEFHTHDGGKGQAGWAEVDLGDADSDPEAGLPGRALDEPELGGDPAEA